MQMFCYNIFAYNESSTGTQNVQTRCRVLRRFIETVADPGFPVGGGRAPISVGVDL